MLSLARSFYYTTHPSRTHKHRYGTAGNIDVARRMRLLRRVTREQITTARRTEEVRCEDFGQTERRHLVDDGSTRCDRHHIEQPEEDGEVGLL